MVRRRMAARLPALAAVIFIALGVAGTAALAAMRAEFHAGLRAVPHDPKVDRGSTVTGRAELVRNGTMLRVELTARGLSPNLHHLMHIHGVLDQKNSCPGRDRDTNHDGLISFVEGLPDYGPVDVALTTRGDTSPNSGGALGRMPRANGNGVLHYQRTFSVPRAVAFHLNNLHIVIHGEAELGGAKRFYDDGRKFDKTMELTLPVSCGGIARDR
jgi:hypothetical protein